MILRYTKARPWVVSPTRANPSDAGLDVYYSPEPAFNFVTDESREPDCGGDTHHMLQPGQSKIFPTGLKFEVPHGYMLEVKNRSGNAAKRNLVVGACVIDSGYSGEVFIDLHNIGTEEQEIHAGMKIAQLVLLPVVHFQPVESTEEELYKYPVTISNRGANALGSTDG